jgi:hypothetical protein
MYIIEREFREGLIPLVPRERRHDRALWRHVLEVNRRWAGWS